MENGISNGKNLTSIYKRLFKLFLINEINKLNLNDSDSIRSSSNSGYMIFNSEFRNSNNLSSFEDYNINKEIDINDFFSNDENLDNMNCPFWDISKTSTNNSYQNSNSNIYNCNYNLINQNAYINLNNPFKSNSKSSNSEEDVYSLEFQGRYFIEK